MSSEPRPSSPLIASTGLPRRTLDTRARIMLPFCALLLLGLAVHRLVIADPEWPGHVEITGRTMGTTYSVKIATAELSPTSRTELAQAIEDKLDRVNSLMSTYLDDSELSRFNRHASQEPFAVSAEMIAVFQIAQAVSEISQGAFDITVRPLVSAWGFGATDRPPKPPSETELRELSRRVGFAKLSVLPDLQSLAKRDSLVECDLSAIAKGYGVDQIAQTVEALGYANYLVEIGGELRAHGQKSDGRTWRIGIERPDGVARMSHQVVVLANISIATSGDYRDYYEVDGQRISHTIDPRSQRPIQHALASVSVLHEQAAWADALATALNVMGPEEGFRFANEHDIAALFLVREPTGQFRALTTPAFERHGEATSGQQAAEQLRAEPDAGSGLFRSLLGSQSASAPRPISRRDHG